MFRFFFPDAENIIEMQNSYFKGFAWLQSALDYTTPITCFSPPSLPMPLSCPSRTFRVVGQSEEADAGSPDPGAKHRDTVGVSTEEADVLADPPQCLDLIQQTIVALGSLVASAEEACRRTQTNKTDSVKANCSRRRCT